MNDGFNLDNFLDTVESTVVPEEVPSNAVVAETESVPEEKIPKKVESAQNLVSKKEPVVSPKKVVAEPKLESQPFDPDSDILNPKPVKKEPQQPKQSVKMRQEKPKLQNKVQGGHYLRDFPRPIMSLVRQEFSDSNNLVDALVSYIYCHSDEFFREKAVSHLTDEQKQLIYQWDMKHEKTVGQNITALIKKVDKLRTQMDTIALLSGYSVFDRIGFRQENPRRPVDVNFVEDGMVAMLEHAVAQTETYHDQRKQYNQTGQYSEENR